MAILKKSVWVTLKEYVIITIGVFAYVLGWTTFLVPNNLIGGGVTGVASIVQYATGIKIGYTYFVVNIALIIAALFVLGKGFGGKTIYATIVTSLAMNIMQAVIPADITQILAVDNGKLMSTIMGGILAGTGIGMTISQGGSTGGTDIIALMINKYRNVSPGRMIMLMDVVIILSSFFVPSYMPDGSLMPWADKITTVVYGFILVVIVSTVLDLYLSGSRQSVQIFVLSHKYQQIADAITNDLHRGVTVLDGKGWYTKNEVNVVMVITRKTELNIFLKYINAIDPDAFVSVSSVTGVYGKGFDTMKFSKKSK
ncbi:MAG TPA: hypothetical protein DCW53_02635 [Rikenellaceae bacterium]|nr:hypothetical protein [Rikenellaceae bacterium]